MLRLCETGICKNMKRRDELPEQSRRFSSPATLTGLVFESGCCGTIQGKEKHSWKVQGWAVLLLEEMSGKAIHTTKRKTTFWKLHWFQELWQLSPLRIWLLVFDPS